MIANVQDNAVWIKGNHAIRFGGQYDQFRADPFGPGAFGAPYIPNYVIGGGTGTTAVLITKGQQLTLEPETKVNFVLLRDVDLPVIRTTNT